jgi:hypothetical protein
MTSEGLQDFSHKYEAYGLKIHSSIPLPELNQSKSEIADITIYLGEFEWPNENILRKDLSYIETENVIYRFWNEIGKFKITKNSIIITPVYGINKVILKNFLLGTVFATLLRMRGLFVLHASSVNINGSAVAFSGFKGYGKSTTAMAFYNEGHPIVADDYIAIKFDNYKPLVYPGFPSLRLSNESRDVMGFDESSNNEIDKKYASVPKFFSSNIIPLQKIYILERSEKSKITRLKPSEAFIELVKNTFGIHLFSNSELPDNFFQCERLVNKVDISILEIPDSIERIHEVIKLVKEDMQNL